MLKEKSSNYQEHDYSLGFWSFGLFNFLRIGKLSPKLLILKSLSPESNEELPSSLKSMAMVKILT